MFDYDNSISDALSRIFPNVQSPKKVVAYDYKDEEITKGEKVYVGADTLVAEDDLTEFGRYKVINTTPNEKLKSIQDLLSMTVEEDKEIMEEINEYLDEVLFYLIEKVGIDEYYDMELQTAEESV